MKLKQLLEDDRVASLPIRQAIVVRAATLVRAAVAQMRYKRVGCAFIVNDEGRPVGMFTERSLLDVLLSGASLDETAVGEFADPDFKTVALRESISRVWERIVNDGARFQCVINDQGRLVGLTGQRGLAEYVSEHYPRQVMVHRLGHKPWTLAREGA